MTNMKAQARGRHEQTGKSTAGTKEHIYYYTHNSKTEEI